MELKMFNSWPVTPSNAAFVSAELSLWQAGLDWEKRLKDAGINLGNVDQQPNQPAEHIEKTDKKSF